MSIIIFTRPVHSGKTTELLQWCSRRDNLYGVAMPDIDGSRKIIDLHSKEIFDIESVDANTNEALTPVGRFHFYTAAFEKANGIIRSALQHHPNWLIIDEAGKLELDGRGFYSSIQEAVNIYADAKVPGTLLLTVRKSLLADIIRCFNLANPEIIYSTDDID